MAIYRYIYLAEEDVLAQGKVLDPGRLRDVCSAALELVAKLRGALVRLGDCHLGEQAGEQR